MMFVAACFPAAAKSEFRYFFSHLIVTNVLVDFMCYPEKIFGYSDYQEERLITAVCKHRKNNSKQLGMGDYTVSHFHTKHLYTRDYFSKKAFPGGSAVNYQKASL